MKVPSQGDSEPDIQPGEATKLDVATCLRWARPPVCVGTQTGHSRQVAVNLKELGYGG